MTVRIGMIGPGGMGQAHIDRIHTVIAGGRVVAVTDVDAGAREGGGRPDRGDGIRAAPRASSVPTRSTP